MIDVREVDPRKDHFRSAISKPVPFSPFRYLGLLLPMLLLGWYWAGESLHKLELDWARANPGESRPLAELCASGASDACDPYNTIAFTHWLALAVLLFLPKFMLLAASLPAWSQRWQERFLRHARWLGAIGLLVTLTMVLARGAVAALTAWFIPQIWWENHTIGVQIATVICIIAAIRTPPHLKAIWQLWHGISRSRTGKPVTPAEAPALWLLVNQACAHLDIPAPDYLVMGVAPDCRLTFGKMRLQPDRKVLDGRVLYIGATLAATLDEARLALLIEHAMLRSRGKYGAWLPAAEDWIESSAGYLKEHKEMRAAGGVPSAVDPALFCWEGWLILLKKMLANFKEEHAWLQKQGMELEVEQDAPHVAELLKEAAQAYRKDVFHLFVVNLSSGVHCPAVLSWFARAFAQRRPGDAAANAHAWTSAALESELVLLEKEWLVATSQATTPTDCWELRAA